VLFIFLVRVGVANCDVTLGDALEPQSGTHEKDFMKATLPAVLGMLCSAGCGGGSPATPSLPPPPVTGATLTLSGIVYGVDATGRRPLAGATVDISEPEAAWGTFGRPVTNGSGRYAFRSLSPRHYQARATMTGYDESPVVTLGYLETSKTLDFELAQTGLTTGPMTVTSIDPAAGSTGGGTPVTILGAGFRSNTTVTFDTESTTGYFLDTTTIYAITPAHAAATVNVKVTSSTGESATLTRGFVYAAPQSFNFNGTWTGYALAHPTLQEGVNSSPRHSDMEMQFTIENNVLTGFACGGSTISSSAPLPAVSNGAFSFTDVGITLSGRIVSAATAIGTINTAACPGTRWEATRQ